MARLSFSRRRRGGLPRLQLPKASSGCSLGKAKSVSESREQILPSAKASSDGHHNGRPVQSQIGKPQATSSCVLRLCTYARNLPKRYRPSPKYIATSFVTACTLPYKMPLQSNRYCTGSLWVSRRLIGLKHERRKRTTIVVVLPNQPSDGLFPKNLLQTSASDRISALCAVVPMSSTGGLSPISASRYLVADSNSSRNAIALG